MLAEQSMQTLLTTFCYLTALHMSQQNGAHMPMTTWYVLLSRPSNPCGLQYHMATGNAKLLSSLQSMVRSSKGKQANLHRPHLNHGPFGSAILLTEMWLGMAVAIHLEGKDSIHSFIIGSLRFLLPSRV